MDAAVFNPVSQTSPELISATEAVLFSDRELQTKAIRKLNEYINNRLVTANLPSASTNDAVDLKSANAPSANTRHAVDLKSTNVPSTSTKSAADSLPSRKELDLVFSALINQEFLNLPYFRRKRLTTLMQEKYFGFSQDLLAPSSTDLAAFVVNNPWMFDSAAGTIPMPTAISASAMQVLRQSVSTRGALARVLCLALPGVLKSEQEGVNVIKQFFDQEVTRRQVSGRSLADALGPLIDEVNAPPVLPLRAGAFSIRSFESELRQLLNRFAASKNSSTRMGNSLANSPDVQRMDPDKLLAEVLARLLLSAVCMLHLRLGK
jgi:hypothetical protein